MTLLEQPLKALRYFCEEYDPHSEKFKFGVLAVGIFLKNYLKITSEAAKSTPDDFAKVQGSLKDLVSLLKSGPNEQQIRKWIDSHFP